MVLFHELGHAVAAWVTGGSVTEIGLNPMQGGHTLTKGGFRLLILNAGYLGSLAAGVGLLWASRTEKHARIAAWTLAAVTGITAMLFVRPFFGFGQVFALVATAGVAALVRFGSAELTAMALRGLGVFSVLYALFDIRDDVFRAPSDAVTDASMLAEATFIPSVFWGALWLVIGVFTLWKVRKWIV